MSEIFAGTVEVQDGSGQTTLQLDAMRVADPARAFGAVIGKALAPLAEGRGLVPILVALQ